MNAACVCRRAISVSSVARAYLGLVTLLINARLADLMSSTLTRNILRHRHVCQQGLVRIGEMSAGQRPIVRVEMRCVTTEVSALAYLGPEAMFIKVGHEVLYRWTDVLNWLGHNTIHRTDNPC